MIEVVFAFIPSLSQILLALYCQGNQTYYSLWNNLLCYNSIARAYFYVDFEDIVEKRVMRKPKDSYVCPRCGYVLPKEEATISGYDSQSSLRHVHCPRCGKIIARYVK